MPGTSGAIELAMPTRLTVQGSNGLVLAEGILDQGHCLLELAPLGQSPIPHSCRSAACGTCRMRVLCGGEALTRAECDETDVLEMYALTAPEARLACQARLSGSAESVRVEVLEGQLPW
jgi:ferredoxin